jgi:hypothetical protein
MKSSLFKYMVRIAWLGCVPSLFAQNATFTPSSTRTATVTATQTGTILTSTPTYSMTPNPAMTPPCSPASILGLQTGSAGSVSGNGIRLSRFTLSQSATVYNISVFVYAVGETQLDLGVYETNGNNVGNLIADAGSATAYNGWNGLPFSTPLELNAGDYWLAYAYTTTGAVSVYVNTTTAVSQLAYSSTVTFGALPTSLSGLAYGSAHDKIIAAYCVGGTPFPTWTITPSYTPTATNTLTLTNTPSGSWTPAWTGTPSNTRTITPTPTITATPTSTLTQTPTNTFTSTGTLLTSTPSFTPTGTHTVTPNPSLTPPCSPVSLLGTTTGAGAVASSSTGIRFNRLTLSQPATLYTISAYLTFSGSTSIGLGIYETSGASIGHLIADAGNGPALEGWNSTPFATPLQLNAGSYWLAYEYTSDGSVTLFYNSLPSGTNIFAYNTSPITFGPMASISSDVTYISDWQERIYAAYCPATTPFPTWTMTPTITYTTTNTLTPTITPSGSWTPAWTATSTLTYTPSPTPTITNTFTPTISFTGTHSFTPTGTVFTNTITPTVTNTNTVTPNPSLTPPCSPASLLGVNTGTGAEASSSSGIRLSRFTLSGPATLYTISAYLTFSGSTSIGLGIYETSGASIGNLIADAGYDSALEGWNSKPFATPLQLNAGSYWLAYEYTSDGSVTLFYNSLSSGTSIFSYNTSPVTFGALPTSLAGSVTYISDWQERIYAAYCPATTPFPTSTMTPSYTPTVTSTLTLTITPSGSWTPAWTGTPSNTRTITPTPTITSTPTSTLTQTPTNTSTPTGTLLTSTPSFTPTGTNTVTPNPSLTPPCSPSFPFGSHHRHRRRGVFFLRHPPQPLHFERARHPLFHFRLPHLQRLYQHRLGHL